MKQSLAFLGCILLTIPVTAAPKRPAFAPVTEEPGLPRVLLIGDSISIGYTLGVRKLLEGKANVHRIPTNGGPTSKGLERLDDWLTTGGKTARDWDVIHFNWGLHDLCYRNPDANTPGHRDKVNGTVTHSPAEYRRNLQELVDRLEETGATLIFATTTPVPEGEAGRKLGDDRVYNEVAREVMAEHDVRINDLHAVMAGKMETYATRPGNVHFTEEGSRRLAEEVVRSIEDVLPESGDETVQVLFDGSDLAAWEFPEGAWYIDDDGALTCRMKEVKGKNGRVRVRGRGNIWSRESYGDFELRVSYKLSEGANSGIFYRSNPESPVQDGLEIQLMDNEGFQKTHGKKEDRKLNASFYDGKAPRKDASRPVGEWNDLVLRCDGPHIQVTLNGEQVIDVNIDDWDTPGRNPDGTPNKFKKALKDFPRSGRIGLQNHGQVVWFEDIRIRQL